MIFFMEIEYSKRPKYSGLGRSVYPISTRGGTFSPPSTTSPHGFSDLVSALDSLALEIFTRDYLFDKCLIFFFLFFNDEYRWWRHSQFWWCWKWYSQWRLSNSKSLCGKSLTFCRIYVFKRLPTYVWCTRKASTTYSWTRKFILKLLTFHIFGVSIISILKYPVIQLFQSYSRKLKISTISIMWKSFQLTHSLFRYGSMSFVLIIICI